MVLAHSAVLSGLAANPALPGRLLDRFVEVADPELCLDLADRGDLTAAQARRLAARGGAETAVRLVRRRLVPVAAFDARLVLALLEEADAPEAWTRALCSDPDPAIRAALAAAAHVPADVLADLAGDAEVEVAEAVGESARLTGDLARVLAGHPHLTVRRAVAGNDRTPPPLLAALAAGTASTPARWCAGCDGRGTPPAWMRCTGDHETALIELAHALVVNPATPAEAVAGYAEHAAATVRWALAERPDLPQRAYDLLTRDPVPGVRDTVAQNPAIDERSMWTLAGDPYDEVRRRLAHNPAVPLEILARIAPVTRIGPTLLPRIATATATEIEALARSPVPALRMLLAQRPDLPPPVVDLLAEDPDAKVLNSLAATAELTGVQLRTIVARHGARVAAAVARNLACDPQLLHHLAVRTPPVQKALRVIAAHPNADAAALLHCLPDLRARPIAARHPALPPATIIELLDDPDERVAEAAAANPCLPPATMERLLNDGSRGGL